MQTKETSQKTKRERLGRAAVAVVLTVVLLFPAAALLTPPDPLTLLFVLLVAAILGLPVANAVDRRDVGVRMLLFVLAVFWIALVLAALGVIALVALLGVEMGFSLQALALAGAYIGTAAFVRRVYRRT